MNLQTRVFDLADALLSCAYRALATTVGGAPTRHCVVPGSDVEFINCCDGPRGGQLTLHVESAFPSRSFPTPDSTPNNCDVPYTVFVYNFTVLRCAPVGSIEQPPTCDQLETSARKVFADYTALRDGVRCCLIEKENIEELVGVGFRWMLGDHVSIGPDGGCAGSSLQVLVGVPTCNDCEALGL